MILRGGITLIASPIQQFQAQVRPLIVDQGYSHLRQRLAARMIASHVLIYYVDEVRILVGASPLSEVAKIKCDGDVPSAIIVPHHVVALSPKGSHEGSGLPVGDTQPFEVEYVFLHGHRAPGQVSVLHHRHPLPR